MPSSVITDPEVGHAIATDPGNHTLSDLTAALCAKIPTPGGGGAAATTAALGAASGAMSAVYTNRKKDRESGAAAVAQLLAEKLTVSTKDFLELAGKDAVCYKALQGTWSKDSTLSEGEKTQIEKNALDVPCDTLKRCHADASEMVGFVQSGQCNPNIVSDALVCVHLLCGAGRAAFATLKVNNPGEGLLGEMKKLVDDLGRMEREILGS